MCQVFRCQVRGVKCQVLGTGGELGIANWDGEVRSGGETSIRIS